MARQYYADAGGGLARTTVANVSTSKVALTFTPDASATYLVIASGIMDVAASGSACLVTVTDGTTTWVDLDWVADVQEDATTRKAFVQFFPVTFGASPASTTYTVKFLSGGSTQTAGLQQARLIALKLTANDQSAFVALPSSVVASTTYVAAASLTLTAGDKLMMASASSSTTSGTNPGAQLRGNHAGTAWGAAAPIRGSGNSAKDPYWSIVRRTAVAGNVLSIDNAALRTSSDTIQTRNACVVALHVADLPAISSNEAAAETTAPVAPTWTAKASFTAAAPAVAHLLLAGGLGRPNVTATGVVSQTIRITEAGAAQNVAAVQTMSSGTPSNLECEGFAWVETPSGASQTWALEHQMSVTGAAGNFSAAGIYLLQLADTPSASRGPPPFQTNPPAAGFLAAYLPGA